MRPALVVWTGRPGLACFGFIESISTTPATSAGYACANTRTVKPPSECPTSDVRTRNVGVLQQRVQLLRELLGIAWQRTSLAVAHARAIVGADPRGLGRFRLHPTAPRRRPIAQSGVDHHGRTTRADAVDVKPIAAHIDQLTGAGYARASAASATHS